MRVYDPLRNCVAADLVVYREQQDGAMQDVLQAQGGSSCSSLGGPSSNGVLLCAVVTTCCFSALCPLANRPLSLRVAVLLQHRCLWRCGGVVACAMLRLMVWLHARCCT
jgi:hypothetical protein